MTTDSVAAIVVTYNRKHLLQQCLEAVTGQSRPVQRIIVVDNASTDGTEEFLREAGYLSLPHFDYLRQPVNIGPAGAVDEGLRAGRRGDWDWIWFMDDDARPEPTALERLLDEPCAQSAPVRGPLILDSEGSGDLSFYHNIEGRIVYRPEEFPPDMRCVDYVHLFNGSLIAAEVFDRVGYLRREMYMWGEEREYYLRLERAGVKAVTVLASHMFHPKDRKAFNRSRIGGAIMDTSPLRLYCHHRNSAYMRRTYQGASRATLLWVAIKEFVKYSLRLRPQLALLVFSAMVAGAWGHWGGERRLLPAHNRLPPPLDPSSLQDRR